MLIEIVGLPGSGKSTYMSKLLAKKQVRKRYGTWEQTKSLATLDFLSNNSLPMSRFNISIFKVLCRVPFINRISSEVLLQKKIKYSTSMQDDSWGVISEIIIKEIMNRKILKPSMKPHYINWELEKIMRTRLLKEYSISTGRDIILDEGIITALSTLENIADGSKYLNKENTPDIVIFLNTDLNVVVDIAENRKQDGRQVQLLDKSRDEIYSFYKEKLKKYHKILKMLKSKGVCVLEINRNMKINELIEDLNSYANIK